MKKFNLMLLVLAGTIGCGAYAAEKEQLTPRTKALVQAITDVREKLFYSERHANLLIQLAETTAARLEAVKSEMEKDIANKQAVVGSIEAAQKRIFEQHVD